MASKKANSGRVTRADVAKKAGISQTTVAYVLNETPGVKIREETRTKVLQAAKELGYTPSFTARSMKRGRTELIGILTPAPTSQFHPYYAQMLHGIHEAAADSNFHFLSLTRDRQNKYRRCLSQNYLDGVIVIQSDDELEPLRDVLDQGLPAVTVNIRHELNAPQVCMDYEAAMHEAVQNLIARDSRKLLFIHGAWDNQPIQRYKAVFKALSDAHSDADFEQLAIDRYELEPEQITQVLKEGWDGLIVDGYELARDIAYHADYRQRQEPIAMVAMSESPNPAPLGPAVTILQSQPQTSGQFAWGLLLDQLEGRKPKDPIRSLPFLIL